jgi:hypothetical protein
MAKNWLGIRVKTEPAKMRYVQGRIAGFPEEAIQKYYFQALQQLAAETVDVMKNYIEYSPDVRTPTGEARGAKGRVKSGEMRDAIKWSGRKVGKVYRFEIGWLDGRPGYAIFQEQGTKNGVKAMESIAYALEFARREVQMMGENPRAMRTRRNDRWKEQ